MSQKRPSRKSVVKPNPRARAESEDLNAEALNFLAQVEPGCTEENVRDVVAVVQDATPIAGLELLKAGFQAVERLCAQVAPAGGFQALLRNQGLETLAYVALSGPDGSRDQAAAALAALLHRAAIWLDAVDPVDFTDLPAVMDLGRTLAILPEGEAVAMSFLGAVGAFCAHRMENCMAILECEGTRLFHMLLGAHRAPDFCHEVLLVLYRLCDLPADLFAAHVKEEIGIIATIVETLNMAPLNMRLQVAGLRLLCLWNQPEEFPADMEFYQKKDRTKVKDALRKAMMDAGAPACLQRTLTNLKNAGLQFQASWVSTIGSGTLASGALQPRARLLSKEVPA